VSSVDNVSAVIWTLLDAGADVNAQAEEGEYTPLHYAARHSATPAVIWILVTAGADVNARNLVGETPLHNAAWHNDNPAVITALLDAGADTTALDAYGRSPWNYARGREGLEGTDALLRLYEGRPR
jgi:ankyrin repeat protein